MRNLTNEIAHSATNFTAGTYAVKDTIQLSSNLVIPENVTLIFQGGKLEVAEGCTAEISIYGSNTRLEAPICTIFGKGVNAKGSWDIDRAYPQWFEIEDDNDWSLPINKAITMKQTGEVFLKSGTYNIHNPITINAGITLCGERGQGNNNSTKITLIGFNGTYVAYVNSTISINDKEETIEEAVVNHIGQNTILKNLVFRAESNSIHNKCILAGSGVHFDYIQWYYFKQCIKYVGIYNDCKRITNCSLNCDGKQDSSIEDIYAIDVSWLGDAFKFEHNAIHQTITGKALKIDRCGGASIQGNIINGDVLIKGSKAIAFNANHCEGGMQLTIEDSCVATNNNYFHKGTVPNITIKSSGNADKSVVTLNNDMFMFLETSVNEYNNTEDKISIHDRINNTSIYDICIDRHSILDITNVYRYESIIDFYKMYPCGISLCERIIEKVEDQETTKYRPIKEFNNNSYIASCKSQMLSNYCLNIQATIRDTNTSAISNVQHSNSICWFADGGTYRYYYQILWDETRGIKKTGSSTSTSDSIFPVKWFANNAYSDSQEKEEISETAKSGVLIGMPKDVNGNCSIVRLFRELVRYSNGLYPLNNYKYQYVDIPVCGTQYLFDNGISICGYKWKSKEASSLFSQDTCDKNMEMLRIIDGNVECFTKREGGITPTSGWKRGDVIHNISNTPSTYIVPDNID